MLLSIFAGMAVTLALAPFNFWPLAILGMALLHYAVSYLSDDKPIKSARITAVLYGLAFNSSLFISGCYWLYISIHTYGGTSAPLAILMMLIFNVFIGTLCIPFIYFYKRYLSHNIIGQSLGFASMWLLLEMFRAWFLTGFPWLFIGYSQIDAPLASYAPFINVFGIGFILALSAASLSIFIKHRHWNHGISLCLVLWLGSWPLAYIEFAENIDDKVYTVGLLQPNVNLSEKWLPQNRHTIINDLVQSSRKLDSDIVIWPETAIPWDYLAASDLLDQIGSQATIKQQAIILGIPSRWRKDQQVIYHNSITGIGKASGLYHKQKLVPFGEYLPFDKQLRGLTDFFNLPMSQFHKGADDQESLHAFGLNIRPYICYEVVYPHFVAKTAVDADILLTVSNDAWFGESIGPLQHFQMVRMRALENSRYMLRSTNNGITAMIDPKGKVINRLPQFEKGVLETEVYARKGLTPVAQYGTIPPIIFSLFIIIGLVLFSYRKGAATNTQ